MREKQIIFDEEKVNISKENLDKKRDNMEQESKNSSKEFEEKSTIIKTSPKKSIVIEIEEEEIEEKEEI